MPRVCISFSLIMTSPYLAPVRAATSALASVSPAAIHADFIAAMSTLLACAAADAFCASSFATSCRSPRACVASCSAAISDACIGVCIRSNVFPPNATLAAGVSPYIPAAFPSAEKSTGRASARLPDIAAVAVRRAFPIAGVAWRTSPSRAPRSTKPLSASAI